MENEIALLDKVLFQLALTPDESLEPQLEKYLVPVIDKLDSKFDGTKKKVLEVLTHISKRVKPNQGIRLPVTDIATQLVCDQVTQSQHSFLWLYFQMGFQRCTEEEKIKVSKILFPKLSNFQPEHQHLFLFAILPILSKLEVEPKEEKDFYLNDEKIRKILLKYLSQVMFLNSNLQFAGNPGLTEQELKLVTKNFDKISQKDFIQIKLTILKFLDSCKFSTIFLADEMINIAIIASGDPMSQISEKGSDLIKVLLKNVNFESKTTLSMLFQLFVGTPLPEKRLPANIQVKEKVLELLTRSTLACNSFPQSVQVVYEALFGGEANARIQMQGLKYVDWICRLAEDSQMKVMSPLLLNGLKKMLTLEGLDKNHETTLKVMSYQGIGMIGKRQPQLFSKNFELLKSFFETVSKERDQNIRQGLQDGLVNLCVAFNDSDQEMKVKIVDLLFEHVKKDNSQSKYLSNYYSLRLFPFSHVPSRFLNLICLNDSNSQVRDESSRGTKPFTLEESVVVKPDPSAKWPDFQDLMRFIGEKINSNHHISGTLYFSNQTFPRILAFCSETLIHQFSDKQDTKDQISQTITNCGDNLTDDNNAIKIYWKLLQNIWLNLGESSQDLLNLALTSSLELFSFQSYSKFESLFNEELDNLITLCKRGGMTKQTRELASKIVGIGYSHLEVSKTDKFISELLPQVSSTDESIKNRDLKIGSIYLLGSCASHSLQINQQINQENIQKAITILLENCNITKSNANSNVLAGPSVQAIGLIGRYKDLTSAFSLEEIKTKLLSYVKTADDNTIELFATAMANICLGCRNPDLLKEVSEALLQLYKRRLDLQFTIGELMSVVVSGWDSTASQESIVIFDDSVRKTPQTDEPMKSILRTILGEYLLSDRVDTRSPAASKLSIQ